MNDARLPQPFRRRAMKWIINQLWASISANLLLVLLLYSYPTTAVAQANGIFTPTGSMATARSGHTATLLLNGKVLIAGGSQERPSSAELYDPAIDTFTSTGDMTTPRYGHSATLLWDGRVLIAGGYYFRPLGTAELYDPSTGTFTPTGNMVSPQLGHRATLLSNGKVLLAGGGTDCTNNRDGCETADNPEIYDPETATFTATGDYADRSGDPWFGTEGLVGAPATLLPGGEVLIASEPAAELYNPLTGTFRVAGQMTRASSWPTTPGWQLGGIATLLADGNVLLAGGEIFEFDYLADAEIYDAASGNFTPIGLMTHARAAHTATLLTDGRVLIAGGATFPCVGMRCDADAFRDPDLYDPATRTFTPAGNMTAPRRDHTATLLMDGTILITGGFTYARGSSPTASAELYTPSTLVPAQIVTDLQFDRASVAAGSSYSVIFFGSNLTPQTFFDVRFTAPGSNASDFVLNWQRGIALSHDVSLDTALGNWTINGVRPHEIETDHTGIFFPVSATITVSP
jgi:hypothetical protein